MEDEVLIRSVMGVLVVGGVQLGLGGGGEASTSYCMNLVLGFWSRQTGAGSGKAVLLEWLGNQFQSLFRELYWMGLGLRVKVSLAGLTRCCSSEAAGNP